MKLLSRLLLAQLPLAIALVLVGLSAQLILHRLGDSAQVILKDNYQSVLAAQRMKDAVERLDSGSLFMIAGQAEKGQAQLQAHVSPFEAALKAGESNITEAGERELLVALRQSWQHYRDALLHYQQEQSLEARALQYRETLEPLFLKVKRQADDVLALNQDAMLHKSERVEAQMRQVTSWMAILALVAFVLGAWGSSSLTRRILRPLTVLTHTAHRLGKGDLHARAAVEGPAELVTLGEELNALAERVQQYQRSSLGQLLQAQLASQSAIDSIPDPVLLFGIDGHVLNVNRAAEERLGVRTQAEASDPLSRVAQPIQAVLRRVCAHVLEGRGAYIPQGFEDSVAAQTPLGELWLLPRAEPVYGETEGIIGTTVILQDVTRLRRFDELKNDLVATVAHELRTPLTSLRMAIHLLAEGLAGPVTEKQEELLCASREDCERLQSIVEDLLDLARIQSGRVQLSVQPIEADVLAQGAIEATRDGAAQRQIRLIGELLALGRLVMADAERIRLVFSNLLGNALRHTPAGGQIVVRTRPVPGCVRFEVVDSGGGIAPEHQEQLFVRFFQIPGAQKGGAGLGLSICQEVIKAHGGQIGVESHVGEGSLFWFTLPEQTSGV